MQLVRLATVTLSRDVGGWRNLEATVGGVAVHVDEVRKTDHSEAPQILANTRLLTARVPLAGLPTIDAENLIDVPASPRRACEEAIESVANLIAVMERCGRHVSSPWPPVAFCPDTAAELDWLEQSAGIRYSCTSSSSAQSPSLELSAELLEAVSDRLDGLQAVATFVSQPHPLAQYREAVRFFELAFRRPVTQLNKKLHQFLSAGPFGHGREEIRGWTTHRHGAMHGDGKTTTAVVWDADVMAMTGRLEEALYDVLFNKVEWGEPSAGRRPTWRPTSGARGDRGDVFVTRGAGVSVRIQVQVFDGFNAYPHNADAQLSPSQLGLWAKFPVSAQTLAEGGFIVEDSPQALEGCEPPATD